MKIVYAFLIFLGLFIAGCSDVKPHISLFGSQTPEPYAPEKNNPANTELSSLYVSTSNGGYVLQSVVSKEDKFSTLVSQEGYQLILNDSF